MAVRPVKASGIAGVTPAQREEIMKLFPRRGTGEILRDYEQGIVQGGRSDLVPGGFLRPIPDIPQFSKFDEADTAGQLLLQNIGNLGISGINALNALTSDALNVGREASGIMLAAPFAAADIFNAPTDAGYMRSLDDFAQGILDMETQKAAQAAKAARMASGIGRRPASMTGVAGGPTYAQTPTDADQDSAIRSQIEDARAISDESGSVNFTGDVGPGSLVAGNIFKPEPADRNPAGGTLFGDPVETTPAQDQETAGILTKLIQDSATRGGAETAATDGKESSTTVQGDVTDITDQPDDLVETDPRFGAETSIGSGGQTTEQKKGSLYEGLLKQSLDSYNTLVDNAPSGAKTMEEYKKEFSDATGIDITGQPDNSAALTAFGLALMQNKAGKGFDVGELLSETGKAGEKALPLMAQARKEAREAQIAAGQYALGATKEDKAARAKSLDEATKYLVGRRDTILDQERARIEALEDFDKKRIAEIELETIKAGFDAEIEWQKTLAAANEPNFKVGNVKDWQPLGNTMPVKITMGIKEKDGRPVFLFPAEQAETLGQALADVTDGMNSLDSLRDKIIEASRTPAGEFAGISGQKAYEVYQRWAASLGYDAGKVPQFDKDGKFTGELKREMPIQEADAIRQRLIAQFKRFLTQETGNGISNVDVQNIETLLGQINFLTDPQGALNRLEEVRGIFKASESKITGALKKFDNKDRYQTPEEYNLARQAISDGINRAFYKKGNISGGVESSFNFTVDDDGNQVYDFTQ